MSGEGEVRGGFSRRGRLATSGDIVNGGCAPGAELVGTGVSVHGRCVGADVRGGEVGAASHGVLLEEVGDLRVESQHDHRDVEAVGDGDESSVCVWGDVR